MKRLSLVIAMVLFAVGYAAAQRAITGKVTSRDGEPLIGASVLVEGATTGTVTDFDGMFNVSVPASGEKLIISYTGFATQEVDLSNGQTNYDIVLSEGINMSEVVVTGVGVATDRRRTAISVEAIGADELPQVASGSIDQALVGKIPGAYIQQSSGQPGQQANIILRGINSLGGTNPMIMIDGVQISTDNTFNGSALNSSSRLADIDFNNVERIEVVQGAAAATIYGAQGANGVIQIFTKKGRPGKTRVSLNTSIGISNPLFGNFGYAENHAYQTTADGRILASGTDIISQDDFGVWTEPLLESGNDARTDNPYVEPVFNHLDQVFREDVANFRTSLSISGGADDINYNVTGTFNDQQSAIRGGNERVNLGTRLGFKVFDKVNVNLGLSFIRGNNDAGGITGTDNVFSALGSVSTTFRFIDFGFRTREGNLVANPTGDNSVNPLFTEENRLRQSRLTRVLPNINVNWEVNDFLTLDYKYGLDYYRDDYNESISNQLDVLGSSTQSGIDPVRGRLERRLQEGTLQNSIASAFLTFGQDDGWLSRTQVAFDWRQRDFTNTFAQGTGIPARADITLRAAEESNIDAFEETFVTYGGLINQRVEFEGKVGVSAGIRADYSSAFGGGSDAFIFPRGDIYVRLSEFGFWSGSKTAFPEFKLRAAYGEAGVQPGAFDRIRTLNAGQIGSSGFLAPQTAQTNPDLGVQVSKEFEVGFDATITPGGRTSGWFPYFNVGFTYWDRTSEDVIRAIGVAPSTGATTLLDNAITLSSNGIQASLQLAVVDQPNFGWNFTTNFTRQQTIVDAISNGVDIPIDDNFLLAPGVALGTLRGQIALTSIDQQDADGNFYLGDDRSGFEIVPESGYVVNSETKQVQFSNDVVEIGSGLPDFNMSFIQDFRIGRAFKVGFQFDWVQGFDIYNQTRQWGYRDNLHADVDDPVTIGGETGAFLNYYRSLYNTNNPNSAFIEEGSFLRLRNASASVDLAKFFTIPGISRIQVEFTGFNLFTITDYSGFDPEAASNLNDPTRIGLDQYAFPNSRVYQFGLNLGF